MRVENIRVRSVIKGVFWLSLLVIVKLPFLIYYAIQFLLNSPFFPGYNTFLWACLSFAVTYICAGIYFNLRYLFKNELALSNWHLLGVVFSISLILVPSPVYLKYKLLEQRDSIYCDCALKGIIDPEDKSIFENFRARVADRFKPASDGAIYIHLKPGYLLVVKKSSVVLSYDEGNEPQKRSIDLPYPLTTKKGVKLGDSEALVRNLYAGPYFINSLPDNARELVYSRPHNFGEEMRLVFRSDKLVSIEILL